MVIDMGMWAVKPFDYFHESTQIFTSPDPVTSTKTNPKMRPYA